jgi:hypothetical protein
VDWVKLSSNYYNDPAIMRAGEAAEVLFTRALGYCGEQETEGFVPAEVLPRLTPSKATGRAAALVREGLWAAVPGGWQFTAWQKHQTSSDQLAAARESNRRRQAAHRSRVTERRNAVTNALVTPTEVEEELEAAAAAAPDPRPTPTPLPGTVEILKAKLDARKLAVRWDKLTADQVTQIEHLIELHGDAPLVRTSLASFRPDSPPVFAQAWLGAWSALPHPGAGPLALVRPQLCDVHGVTLTPSGTCSSCEADAKAAR